MTDLNVAAQRLEDLGTALAAHNINGTLVQSATGVPMLILAGENGETLAAERIECTNTMQGVLSFAWPWGTWIAPARHTEAAAAEIHRVLTTGLTANHNDDSHDDHAV